MSLAKRVKRAILATNGLGMGVAVARSSWRQNRLLILCYHGIAMGEEAGSHPEMFLPPATFARRMEILSQCDCRVLPLGEALRLVARRENFRREVSPLPLTTAGLTFGRALFPFFSDMVFPRRCI